MIKFIASLLCLVLFQCTLAMERSEEKNDYHEQNINLTIRTQEQTRWDQLSNSLTPCPVPQPSKGFVGFINRFIYGLPKLTPRNLGSLEALPHEVREMILTQVSHIGDLGDLKNLLLSSKSLHLMLKSTPIHIHPTRDVITIGDERFIKLTVLFPRMSSFSASKFQGIADNGFAQFPLLTNLTWLDFTHCLVNDKRIKNLRSMTQLTHLNLEGTKISNTGLSNLAPLTKLKELSLANIKNITGDGLESLKRYNYLESLNLANIIMSVQGYGYVASMTALQRLVLKGTQSNDACLPLLSGLTNLRYLDLSDSPFTDLGVSHLSSLSNLVALSLSRSRITHKGFSVVKHFTLLTSLNGSGLELCDEGTEYLQNLPKLISLDLSENNLTNDCLPSLTILTSLKALVLDKNPMSPTTIAQIKFNLSFKRAPYWYEKIILN